MAKFKITARVQDSDGDAGEIMDKRKGERLIQYDNTDYGLTWLPKSELTALPARAEVFESEYKVGDRVRFIRDNPNGGSAYGGVGQEFVVSSLDADTHEGGKQVKIDHPAHGFKPSVPLSAIEPVTPEAWVPAVGDRVDDPSGGGLATISSIRADGKFLVDWDTGCVGSIHWSADDWKFVSRPEPVDAHATTAWMPKVGDRVRVIDGRGGGKIGDECQVMRIEPAGEHTGSDIFCCLSGLTGGAEGLYSYRLEPLSVAEQPAPLTIEAGKFYRTRDGRKATDGETRDAKYGGGFYFNIGTSTKAYEPNGTHAYGEPELDLVAEWVEPAAQVEVPVEVAVSEATATRRFKVGDVVNYVYDGPQTSWQNITITQDDGKLYHATCPKSGEGAFYEDWLEPATPAATFKVGDRVQYTGSPYPRPCVGTVSKVVGEKVYADDWSEGDSEGFIYADKLTLASFSPLTPGTTVTFTATGRLSAINDNGHIQVTFPGLEPGQNSFALPARHVAAA